MFKTKIYLQGIYFLVGFTLATCCNLGQILSCVESFEKALASGPISSEQSLNTICDSTIPSFKSCLAPHISETSGCDPQVKTSFEGLLDTYDYICNKKEDTVEYLPCLSKSSLVTPLKACKTTLQSKLQSNSQAQRDTVCGYLNEFLECAFDVTKAECGSDAAEYQDKLVQMSTGPLLESMGCGTGGGNGEEVIQVPANINININIFAPSPSTDSGRASTKAMLWIVAAGLLVQWFVRHRT